MKASLDAGEAAHLVFARSAARRDVGPLVVVADDAGDLQIRESRAASASDWPPYAPCFASSAGKRATRPPSRGQRGAPRPPLPRSQSPARSWMRVSAARRPSALQAAQGGSDRRDGCGPALEICGSPDQSAASSHASPAFVKTRYSGLIAVDDRQPPAGWASLVATSRSLGVPIHLLRRGRGTRLAALRHDRVRSKAAAAPCWQSAGANSAGCRRSLVHTWMRNSAGRRPMRQLLLPSSALIRRWRVECRSPGIQKRRSGGSAWRSLLLAWAKRSSRRRAPP